MGIETPSQEQPKSELEKLQAEIEKTQAEILAMDPDAPEMDWLKEKLQGLDTRLSTMEKPKLRTQQDYGIPLSEKRQREEAELDEAAQTIRKGIEEDQENTREAS